MDSTTTRSMPSSSIPFTTEIYRQSYGRINGVVVVGEALAEQHFRLLARAIPEDAGELKRLGAMEGLT